MPVDEIDLDSSDIGLIDPLDGLEFEQPLQRPSTQFSSSQCNTVSTVPLYLDLETTPDEERMHLFDLPPLPDVPPVTTSANCPSPEAVLAFPLEQMERDLLLLNPEDAYLELLVGEEKKKLKPRAGVAGACRAVKSRRENASGTAEAQRKLLSVTPEYCRIVAAGWAIGEVQPCSSIVGVPNKPGGRPQTEENLLSFLWSMIQQHSPIVGFNVLAFDLNVIRARSIILGVQPTKVINESPWNNPHVTDLMNVRFGRSGKAMRLKSLARLYGIHIPAGDVDGSDVERLYREDAARLGEYVRSDVAISRELHRKFQGYFCA